jgi:type II secretory pathway pseudopilin PulG
MELNPMTSTRLHARAVSGQIRRARFCNWFSGIINHLEMPLSGPQNITSGTTMRQRVFCQRRPASTARTKLASRLVSSAGLSLVEVTVMLVILLVLAGALIPVMTDSINSARLVRARNDLSQIAAALTNFQRDVGPFVYDGSRLRLPQTATSLRVVDVLISGGTLPEIAESVPLDPASTHRVDPSVGLTGAGVRPWVTISNFDLLDNHLRVDVRNYPVAIGGPGTGWNGPYLAREITGDPWGRAYLVNVGFLRGTPLGSDRCRDCAVFVISAGPNGMLETPFQQPITNASVFGDDLAVRIQ